jgi:L-ribulose-5-phosphate 3-epimerase
MENSTRRDFLTRSAALVSALSLFENSRRGWVFAGMDTASERISLAQWALNQEIRAGELTNLDFPRIAREEFGIGAIEFVNTLFAVPTYGYLRKLKQNAVDHGVKMLVMMVDDEGDPVAPSRKERDQFVINHRKWVDIAQFLGCHSVRTNCIGRSTSSKSEALKWAAESYTRLLEYALSAKVSVVIENHGGLSDDPDWMVDLIKEVGNPHFGSYIDWRWRDPAVWDNYAYTKKLLPYAKGISYKKQPTVEHLGKLVQLSRDSGYQGYYGIEEKGFDNIKLSKTLLETALQG